MADESRERIKDTPLPPGAEGEATAWLVRGLGIVVTIIGLITWFSAYAGLDDRWQISIGIMITGFGITWWILGVVVRAVTSSK